MSSSEFAALSTQILTRLTRCDFRIDENFECFHLRRRLPIESHEFLNILCVRWNGYRMPDGEDGSLTRIERQNQLRRDRCRCDDVSRWPQRLSGLPSALTRNNVWL